MNRNLAKILHAVGAISTGLLGGVVLLAPLAGILPPFSAAKWIVTVALLVTALASHVIAACAGPAPGEFKVWDLINDDWADTEKIALTEGWAEGLVYCDIEGFALDDTGSLILMDECGNFRACPPGRFKVVYS